MSTWSYTIMGTSKAFYYDAQLFFFIHSFLNRNKRTKDPFPEELFVSLINEKCDELLKLVVEQNSRLAYQVFGVFLMESGAKMTDEVKELILKHSRWEDEEDQLLDPQDKSERLFYLSDFRKRIEEYIEGVKTTVPREFPDDVVQKFRKQGVIKTDYPFIMPPERFPIDHTIIECDNSQG